MLRSVPPYVSNFGKRLVKAPKVFLRDTGLMHSLLDIDSYNQLLGHPSYGQSWESFVCEQLCGTLDKRWQAFFYRTEKGSEIDLILVKRTIIIAIESKSSTSPVLNKGFWYALDDIKPTQTWIAASVEKKYPLCAEKNVFVGNPAHIIDAINTLSTE